MDRFGHDDQSSATNGSQKIGGVGDADGTGIALLDGPEGSPDRGGSLDH